MKTSRLWIAVIIYVINTLENYGLGAYVTLFPVLALKKSMSSAYIGMVFAVQAIVLGVSSIVCLPLLSKLGAKLFLQVQLVGVVLLCFGNGLMEFLPSGWPFIVVSTILFLTYSVFLGAGVVVFIFIVVTLYPERTAQMIGWYNFSTVMGILLGASTGGVIRQFTTYFLPFALDTVLLLVLTVISVFIIPPNVVEDQPSYDTSESTRHYLKVYGRLLRYPPISIGFFCLILVNINFGILTFGLILLKQLYHIKSGIAGFILASSWIGLLLAPCFGYLCDRFNIYIILEVFSIFVSGCAAAFIDPLPILLIGEPKLWLTTLCFILTGIAAGMLSPSVSGKSIKLAHHLLLDQSNAEDAVGALFGFTQSFGLAIGSAVWGLFHQSISLVLTCIGLFECVVGIACMFYYILSRKQSNSEEEDDENKHLVATQNRDTEMTTNIK